jgi:hypothetical protein
VHFFSVGATFSIDSAQFQYNADIFGEGLSFIADYVPSLEAKIASQARKEFVILPGGRKIQGEFNDNNSSRRQLQPGQSRDLDWVDPEHRAYLLLRSLQSDDLLSPDFEYTLCPITDLEQVFCGR